MISHPLAVGVTGGIGSGKTTVSAIFTTFGVQVVSADEMAKHLLNSDKIVRRRIMNEFGTHVYAENDRLDHKRLARIVFQDSSALLKLNRIVHPFLLRSMREVITAFKHRADREILLIDAALIFEAEADGMFDYIILVEAEEDERIRRVVTRDNCSASDVHDRMNTQLSDEKKNARADFVIRNMDNPKKLKEKCQFLFTLLHMIARKT